MRYLPVLWVLLVVFLVLSSDVLVFGLLSASLRRIGMEADMSRSLSMLAPLSIAAMAFIVRWKQLRRIRFLLSRHGYLICLRCHYPLSSDEEQGRCPECSVYFQTADVVTAWQEWESLQSTPVHGA